MIDGLGSYSLSDFLLFSQETYYRLFELYNRDVWPVQALVLGLGLGLLWLLLRSNGRRRGRAVAVVLAVLWGWVGWAFHLERYAAINPFATYFAALFAVEALLLLWIGGVRGGFDFADSDCTNSKIGHVILLFSVLIHPVLGVLAGRQWTQLSFFGLAPDPTAMATLGILLVDRARTHWLPLLPAVLWCAVATFTALAMDSIEAVGPAAVALTVLIAVSMRTARTLQS